MYPLYTSRYPPRTPLDKPDTQSPRQLPLSPLAIRPTLKRLQRYQSRCLQANDMYLRFQYPSTIVCLAFLDATRSNFQNSSERVPTGLRYAGCTSHFPVKTMSTTQLPSSFLRCDHSTPKLHQQHPGNRRTQRQHPMSPN